MQALPRLALDRVRIAFEVLHVLFEPVIFLLQGVNLLMKLAILCTLLLISVQAVMSHDHVVAENERQCHRERRGNAPPHAVEKLRRARLQLYFWLAGAHKLLTPRGLRFALSQRLMIGANSSDVAAMGAKNLRRGIYSSTHVLNCDAKPGPQPAIRTRDNGRSSANATKFDFRPPRVGCSLGSFILQPGNRSR